MIKPVLEIRGVSELCAHLEMCKKQVKVAVRNAMEECGKVAYQYSYENAPRSPTQTNARNARRSSASRKKKSAWQRFKAAFSVFKKKRGMRFPGGLEKSIEYKAGKDYAAVYVARNSYAADYARYIHDGKGKLWFNRGAGTIAKGAQADEKFIERALKDHPDVYLMIIEDEVKKVGKN